MYVNHSGWTKGIGFFNYNVFVDENRQDYAVHFADGSVARQESAFERHTADWNHDGDIYAQFGAWFAFRDENGYFKAGEFFTPEQLVQFAIDARDPEASVMGVRPVKVEGIEVPERSKRPKLADRIAQSERRAMHQEVERNRKMKALGIRPSNEPWAR